MKHKFHGILTAIVTPFTEDGSVDTNALKKLVEDQIAAGVHGIVAVASTGEGATLDESDHCLVVDTCIEQANKRVQVLAGAGSNNTKHAVHLQKLMQKRGVVATLHVTPFYNKPTPEGMYQHFRAVAEATDLPLLLYNVPGRTCIDIQPTTVFRLAQDCKNIVGMKDANTDLQRMPLLLDSLRQIRPDFAMLAGEDIFTLPLLAIGGHGVISVSSNVAPKEYVALYNAFMAGNMAKAQELSFRLARLAQLMFFCTNPIPVKSSLYLMGKIQNSFRLPLCSLDDKGMKFLRDSLIDQGWLHG